ncbi:hypothetical protein GCM10010317_039690 [Streptomyces mirabilis]|nr:hypothetical protein GCM10010317_039690 [Streptomyces mirabilis]
MPGPEDGTEFGEDAGAEEPEDGAPIPLVLAPGSLLCSAPAAVLLGLTDRSGVFEGSSGADREGRAAAAGGSSLPESVGVVRLMARVATETRTANAARPPSRGPFRFRPRPSACAGPLRRRWDRGVGGFARWAVVVMAVKAVHTM